MYQRYEYIEGKGVVEISFPEYPDGFSSLKRILYIGCGHDNYGLEALAKNHQYVVGIDKYSCVSQKHIQKREELTTKCPNLQMKEMDARKLVFPSNSFDGVIFKRSLTHIGGENDIKKALRKVRRVLNKDGMVWVIFSRHDIDFSLERIKMLLNSSGFEVVSETESYLACVEQK